MYIHSYSVVIFLMLGSVRMLPSFIFVLTDDQDLVLNSLNFMNSTTKLIANQGKTFSNFFVNAPICCPSRSSLLTGMYPHNCHVFNNSINGGCSSSTWRQNHEPHTIAPLLKKRKNYRTFYAGKYLNQYGGYAPPGYDWWIGLHGNSKYYNYTLCVNGTQEFFTSNYLTDHILEYALDFLDANSGENFFLMLAPPACHSPFTPAPRHQHFFEHLTVPKNRAFNFTPTDKHWLLQMPPQSLPKHVPILDSIYKNRIRTLQAVDEAIESLVQKLNHLGKLDETYIIFASDNGFHVGQFTQPWDKRQPYESDIRVPFLIRGPGIPPKTLTDFPISGVDILPTILDLAEVPMGDLDLDGKSFKDVLFGTTNIYHELVYVEYWGEASPDTIEDTCPWTYDLNLSECVSEAWCKCQDSRNNTYRCVLDLSNNVKIKFCYFQDGFLEVYDLVEDPFELKNLKLDRESVGYYMGLLDLSK